MASSSTGSSGPGSSSLAMSRSSTRRMALRSHCSPAIRSITSDRRRNGSSSAPGRLFLPDGLASDNLIEVAAMKRLDCSPGVTLLAKLSAARVVSPRRLKDPLDHLAWVESGAPFEEAGITGFLDGVPEELARVS